MHVISTLGLDGTDVTVLKCLMRLMKNAKGRTWDFSEEPAKADLVIVSPMLCQEAGRVLDDAVLVVYGKPPEGFDVLYLDKPVRVTALQRVLGVAEEQRLDRLAEQALISELAPLPEEDHSLSSQPLAPLSLEETLVGRIQSMIPRLLLDQPFIVRGKGVPPLLVDSTLGVRGVYADEVWFQDEKPWRKPAAEFELVTEGIELLAKRCRQNNKHRLLQALRFWGVLCASNGTPLSKLSLDLPVQLKQAPNFTVLPHRVHHPALAQAMKEPVFVSELSGRTGVSSCEVVDFCNACLAIDLLRQ